MRSRVASMWLPLLFFGAVIPLASKEYSYVLIGLMGVASCGASTIVVLRHVRRHQAEEGVSVVD